MIFERGVGLRGSLKALTQEFTLNRLGLGFTAFLFAATGPMVILLAAANSAKLPIETTISWIFVVYVVGGIGTLFLALYYRQPIVLAWSIPGAAIVADTMSRTAFSNVLGAYLVIAILLVLLGVTGVVKWVTRWIPVPVLMGMVVAVLLPYGVAVFKALGTIPTVAYPSVGLFLFLAAFPRLSRIFPPVLTTLVVALILATVTNITNWGALRVGIANPVLFVPTFDISVIIELVPPLIVAIIAIQNGQGLGVLLSQGYKPPINLMTTACGIACFINLLFGGHSACIAGPAIAITGSPEAGDPKGRFVGAFFSGAFWIPFGLLAPIAASLDKVLTTPALIQMLGGLAMLSVLVSSFFQAFSGKFRNGALFALLITLSEIKIFSIGSAFWGLVGGMLAVIALDRADFLLLLKENKG